MTSYGVDVIMHLEKIFSALPSQYGGLVKELREALRNPLDSSCYKAIGVAFKKLLY